MIFFIHSKYPLNAGVRPRYNGYGRREGINSLSRPSLRVQVLLEMFVIEQI